MLPPLRIIQTIMNTILLLYVVGFSVSLIWGIRSLFYKQAETASTCFACAIMFLFALVPMFRGGNWVQIIGQPLR